MRYKSIVTRKLDDTLITLKSLKNGLELNKINSIYVIVETLGKIQTNLEEISNFINKEDEGISFD